MGFISWSCCSLCSVMDVLVLYSKWEKAWWEDTDCCQNDWRCCSSIAVILRAPRFSSAQVAGLKASGALQEESDPHCRCEATESLINNDCNWLHCEEYSSAPGSSSGTVLWVKWINTALSTQRKPESNWKIHRQLFCCIYSVYLPEKTETTSQSGDKYCENKEKPGAFTLISVLCALQE